MRRVPSGRQEASPQQTFASPGTLFLNFPASKLVRNKCQQYPVTNKARTKTSSLVVITLTLIFFFFKEKLAWDLLYRLGWPQTHRDLLICCSCLLRVVIIDVHFAHFDLKNWIQIQKPYQIHQQKSSVEFISKFM